MHWLRTGWKWQGVSTFNDDIESTAAAILAAVLGATRLQGVPAFQKQTFLMLGAGQANIGGARLLVKALQAEGMAAAAAKARIWLFDSKVSRKDSRPRSAPGSINELRQDFLMCLLKDPPLFSTNLDNLLIIWSSAAYQEVCDPSLSVQGIVYEGRDEEQLSAEKQEFQRSAAEGQEVQGLSFAQAVHLLNPTAIIGAAAKSSTFTQEVIQNLQQVLPSCASENPAVQALAGRVENNTAVNSSVRHQSSPCAAVDFVLAYQLYWLDTLCSPIQAARRLDSKLKCPVLLVVGVRIAFTFP